MKKQSYWQVYRDEGKPPPQEEAVFGSWGGGYRPASPWALGWTLRLWLGSQPRMEEFPLGFITAASFRAREQTVTLVSLKGVADSCLLILVWSQHLFVPSSRARRISIRSLSEIWGNRCDSALTWFGDLGSNATTCIEMKLGSEAGTLALEMVGCPLGAVWCLLPRLSPSKELISPFFLFLFFFCSPSFFFTFLKTIFHSPFLLFSFPFLPLSSPRNQNFFLFFLFFNLVEILDRKFSKIT